MNIHPFIFSWKGHYERALALEKIFLEIFGRVTVINSDEENRPEHWVNLTDEAYFAEQFATACSLLDGDVMFHVQADVSYFDWNSVVEEAKKYYKKFKFGIYAPNIDHTTCLQVDLDKIQIVGEPNLKLVTVTDCSAWFINRTIINYFDGFVQSYIEAKYGWGICWCLSAISLRLGLPIYRDYNFTLVHPNVTNYNKQSAADEGKNFFSFIKKYDNEVFANMLLLKRKSYKEILLKLNNI
jgi:hypothetical protein